MKVRVRAGRGGRDGGRNTAIVERPVQVHQHCNDWATVDYLDEAGGHDAVSVTALVMESVEDQEVFRPDVQNNGTLWTEFRMEVREAPGESTTWVFVSKESSPHRGGARRSRSRSS